MIYVYVKTNDNDELYVAGIITSPLMVKGLYQNKTYGDIRLVDPKDLQADGIWQQDDVYESSDEYMEFDRKETVFDSETGIVTNTYKYKRMDLDLIKNDISSRVSMYRETVLSAGLDRSGNVYGVTGEFREWLLSLQRYAELNLELTSNDGEVKVRLLNDSFISVKVSELSEIFQDVMEFILGIFTKEEQIKAAIQAATTYEDVRAAANWDGTPL